MQFRALKIGIHERVQIVILENKHRVLTKRLVQRINVMTLQATNQRIADLEHQNNVMKDQREKTLQATNKIIAELENQNNVMKDQREKTLQATNKIIKAREDQVMAGQNRIAELENEIKAREDQREKTLQATKKIIKDHEDKAKADQEKVLQNNVVVEENKRLNEQLAQVEDKWNHMNAMLVEVLKNKDELIVQLKQSDQLLKELTDQYNSRLEKIEEKMNLVQGQSKQSEHAPGKSLVKAIQDYHNDTVRENVVEMKKLQAEVAHHEEESNVWRKRYIDLYNTDICHFCKVEVIPLKNRLQRYENACHITLEAFEFYGENIEIFLKGNPVNNMTKFQILIYCSWSVGNRPTTA